jgi:2-polyprenyl-3-methyl-5-hydroxy-6-metoxy-1,4-benzoquinol methylase
MQQNSLERIVPDVMATNEVMGNETLLLHLERYHYAGRHLIPGRVADIACGVGYGSYLLAMEYSQHVSEIMAVDIDISSIEYARSHYEHALIDFIVSDANNFNAEQPLHNIVSLETIEHIPQPEQFIRHMSKQLVQGGRFIASVPVTPSMDANPYHLHDFTIKNFKKIFVRAGFKELHSYIQVQPYTLFSIITRSEQRSEQLRKNLARYYWQHPGKLILRLQSILKEGFTNKYLVAVFEKL